MLEEVSGHFLVELVEVRLDLPLRLLDHLHNILCVLRHIRLELELLLEGLLLVELHVARLKEMRIDGDHTFDLALPYDPP